MGAEALTVPGDARPASPQITWLQSSVVWEDQLSDSDTSRILINSELDSSKEQNQ